MEMILVRLRPDGPTAARRMSPQLATDILWACAIPTDRLEHIRARPGPDPDAIDVALFHRTGPTPAPGHAYELCLRAIRGSPVLAGWRASVLTDTTPGLSDAFHY